MEQLPEEKVTIFNFNESHTIKGILSAIMDNSEVDKRLNNPFPAPKGYVAEIIAFIWVDENNDWQWKARIKFPSGNKQSFSKNMGKNSNETQCLHAIYKFPMKEKHWFPNPSGGLLDMIKIMKKNDLIEWIEMDESNT